MIESIGGLNFVVGLLEGEIDGNSKACLLLPGMRGNVNKTSKTKP
jgi:hypothetical protein